MLGLSLDVGNASPPSAMDYGQEAIVVGKPRRVGNQPLPFARSLLLPITRRTGVTRVTPNAHNMSIRRIVMITTSMATGMHGM